MSGIPFPFDLPGPQFLAFYLVFAAIVLFALRFLTLRAEDGDPPRVEISDPYRLAYLRGGADEAVRLAIFALADRDFLRLAGNTATAERADRFRAKNPLEQRVMHHFARPQNIDKKGIADLRDWTRRHYEPELVRLKLLPHEAFRARRHWRRNIAWLILIGVAGTKIAVAFATGHTNVIFLIGLTLAAVVLATIVAHPKRTALSRRVIKDMQELFVRLRDRAGEIRPGHQTAEAVLVAAIFGFASLPPAFAGFSGLFPARSKSDGGSGCGSSGGDSGGDGGGGCGGGGGGGCGGCGS